MTRGTLELAFMFTTKLEIDKTTDRWNRYSHKECNGSPGEDDRKGMYAMWLTTVTLVANVGLVRTCRSQNEKAFAWLLEFSQSHKII
jgi:hypothetical protein